MRRSLVVVGMLLVISAGCASVPRARAGTDSGAAIAAWSLRHDRGRQSTTLSTRSSREVVRIGEPAAPPLRATGPRVDVAFEGAELGNALRFLAERAGVGLVLGDSLSGRVSLRLRHVRPLDALFAIAEAHGATAEIERGIVRVTAR
jgi:hypothetical protein